MTFFNWLADHFYEVVILLYLTWYHKTVVLTPLKGGNGVLQWNEVSQGVILVIFVFSVKAEIERTHQWPVFSDAYWFTLLGSVILIAGLKGGKDLIATFKNGGSSGHKVSGENSIGAVKNEVT